MNRLTQIFQAILQTEENIIPLFVHNPVSQKIAGVIVAGESVIMGLVASLHKKPETPAETTEQPAA